MTGSVSLAASEVRRVLGSAAERVEAAAAVTAFGADLAGALAAGPGNLACSPYSVAVALAMTRNGALGRTAEEMDIVLHTPGLDTQNAGLSALTAHVEALAQPVEVGRETLELRLDVANSLWGQQGVEWEQQFLDELARSYGAGMRAVDYKNDAEGARRLINAWTAERTHDKIPELLAPDILDALTRLVLVNAIYLKAPWAEPFSARMTQPGDFRRSDGQVVRVELMTGGLRSASYAHAQGWQIVRMPYAGDDLAMSILLPDDGDGSLPGEALAPLLRAPRRGLQVNLTLPRWRYRTQVELNGVLAALGMPTAFDEVAADFTAMTVEDLQLFISNVVHEAFVAVDEEGTEAAAATAVVAQVVSAPPSVQVDATRTFWFCIHDVETCTPLFIGRVDDPTDDQ